MPAVNCLRSQRSTVSTTHAPKPACGKSFAPQLQKQDPSQPTPRPRDRFLFACRRDTAKIFVVLLSRFNPTVLPVRRSIGSWLWCCGWWLLHCSLLTILDSPVHRAAGILETLALFAKPPSFEDLQARQWLSTGLAPREAAWRAPSLNPTGG
jgi:hypothetical protein